MPPREPPAPPTPEVPTSVPDELAEVALHRVRVPLREPFVAAHGVEVDRQVVLVEAVGVDGARGWGECSTLSRASYSAECTDTAWDHLRAALVPALLAGRPVGPAGAPMAWTGVSTALVDLALRRARRPLSAALGGHRTDVGVTAVVGQRRDLADLLRAVQVRVGEGYRAVKLKISPGADVDRLTAVRMSFPGLSVAADANGSYRLDDVRHRGVLRRLDGLGLAYVEQPLPAGGPGGRSGALADLARLAAGWSTPVALDESVGGAGDAEAAAACGPGFVLNLKPARVGGLDEARRCLAVARAAGWPAFVGGMLETGVGRALALAAASWEACTLPTDVGPSSRYFAEDVTEPIELGPDGRMPVPTGPGLGVTPIPARLDAFRVDLAVVRR